jgi:hypothetical protein
MSAPHVYGLETIRAMGHRGLGPNRTEIGRDRWPLRFGRFRLYPSPRRPRLKVP